MAERLSKAKALREERARMNSRRLEIIEKPGGENGGFSAEQRAELDKIHDASEALKTDIDRIEQAEADERDLSQSRGTRAGQQDTEGNGSETREQRVQKEQVTKVFDTYLRRGFGGMTAEDRALMEGRLQAPEQRAHSTGIDTEGGYLVPDSFEAKVVEARAFHGGMRSSRATILTTAAGNPIHWPTDDDTANEASLVGENQSDSEASLTWGAVRFNAYTYRSGIVKIPRELLQDSAIDLESFVSKKFGRRFAKRTNRDFTTGDGASKPYGVVTQATLGVTGATGQTTTILYDDLVDLEHSVDREYRTNAEWMMGDTMLKTLKKLKDGEGRPLWVPGVAVREPDTILGYRYTVNADVAAPAASAKSLLFGDFENYYIRDVRGMTILRLEERYAEYNQVAFLGFARHDARLVDAGQHPIKYYAHPAA